MRHDDAGEGWRIVRLVTAQAAEIRPVADGATGFVEVEVACAMCAHETLYVIGRLEVIAFRMTLFAAERIVDLAMADQAVRHPGHVDSGDLRTLVQGSMTGLARVCTVQVAADIAGWLKVQLLIDCNRQDRRHIPHSQVLLVAKMSPYGGRGTSDLARLVAGLARFLGGQQVV